jgi:glutamate 5-kinase
MERDKIKKAKRIVVKIGASVLTAKGLRRFG